MKAIWHFALWAIAIAAVSIGATAAAAEAESQLPARPFHLERTEGKRWDMTFTFHHNPFHGDVFYAIPPDDPGQTIEKVELYAQTKRGRIEAQKATDASPHRKPLLKLELSAGSPFVVVARVVVQFHHTKLDAGQPGHKVVSLSRELQKEYLDDGWPNPAARQWFTRWMQQHGLMRGNEEDAAYSFRVLKFVQKNFRYVIPDDLPAYKAMVAKDPEMGLWHYMIQTQTGECLRLSDLYDRVVRMNGVPARLVSGNWLTGDKGHHCRSLIYLTTVGWIPIEATGAVSAPADPAMNFFGTWTGPMLNGNRNLGYELQGPKGKWNIGTLDQLGFAAADGTWDFPPDSINATELPAK